MTLSEAKLEAATVVDCTKNGYILDFVIDGDYDLTTDVDGVFAGVSTNNIVIRNGNATNGVCFGFPIALDDETLEAGCTAPAACAISCDLCFAATTTEVAVQWTNEDNSLSNAICTE